MITEVKSESAAVVPPDTVSTALLGANSVFEPATEFPVELSTGAEATPSLSVVAYPTGAPTGADVVARIAESALGRARAYSRSPQAWIQAGFAALAARDLNEARNSFSTALDLDRNSRTARLGLARTAHEDGRISEAEEILRSLLAESADDTEARVSLAVVLVSDQRWSDALNLLSGQYDPVEANASLFATRGSVRFGLNDCRGAISDLRKALRLRPDWVHVRNVLGLVELRSGHLGAAERHFREAVRTGPMYMEPLLNLVRLLRLEGRWIDLLDSVERYWRPGNSPIEIAVHAADAALEIGNPRAAKNWLEPARDLVRGPKERAEILNNLGVAYSRLRSWSDAEEAFAASAEALPSEINVGNRAKALLETGRPGEAASWLIRWYTDSGYESTELLKTLAVALVRIRKDADALRIAEALVERADADEGVYCLLSSLHVDHFARPDLALKVAEAGLTRWRNSPALINNMAYALILSGRIDEAAAWLDSLDETALPQERLVYLRATRGLLQLCRGDLPAGQSLYEWALANAPSDTLRERVKAKRDLEVGRALLRLGRQDEATRMLTRATERDQAAEPYVSQARSELLRLQAGSVSDSGGVS